MKTNPTQKDLKRRKISEDDRILMSLRYLFNPVKIYTSEYINKKGQKVIHEHRHEYKGKVHRDLTKEEIEFIHTHSAYEIAKHFNKSSSWAYARIAGNYTI